MVPTNCSAPTPDFKAIVAGAEHDELWVLPACKDRKAKHPAIQWKKFQEQRPTEEELATWLRRYPRRNGCYLTGPVLGRFALDCDDARALAWARRQGIPLTQRRMTRRGMQYDFEYPDFKVYTTVSKIYEHIDIKGAGGIAVAVGSIHHTGYQYHWARGGSPADVALAKAPPWLLDWLGDYTNRKIHRVEQTQAPIIARGFYGIAGAWAQAVIEGEIEALAEAVDGTRNAMLARVAFKLGQIVGGDEADFEEVREALLEVAAEWPNLPKSTDTIDRCLEAGMELPRCAPAREVWR